MKFNYGSLALLAIVMPLAVMKFWGPPWTIQHIAGLVIALPCFLLFALARIQLGKAFSVQAKASALVTTGLYSRIRKEAQALAEKFGASYGTVLCEMVVMPLK